MAIGRLGYNSATGRYGLLVSDLWQDMGFHCGECLEVMVDDKWMATRMEMSAEQKWYLLGMSRNISFRAFTDKERRSSVYGENDFNDDGKRFIKS